MGDPGDLRVRRALTRQEISAVGDLVEAATRADGVSPLSEHVQLHLRHDGHDGHGGHSEHRHLLLRHGAAPDAPLVGYAHLDPTDPVTGAVAELVVHPGHRRRGHARTLTRIVIDLAPDARLRLWAHGGLPAAWSLATALGFREGRRLEQWRRPLDLPLPAVELPAGMTVRAFRPGTDDAAWLALNAKAFAGHPEQGGWTAADLDARQASEWFDPNGFLLAEQDGALVAFHWTKVHGTVPRATGAPHCHHPLGEVYVVGVDPDHQGRGLGRAMTVAGLARLRQQGLPDAMLYVDGDNHAARATYARLGFTCWDTDVMFYRTDSVPG